MSIEEYNNINNENDINQNNNCYYTILNKYNNNRNINNNNNILKIEQMEKIINQLNSIDDQQIINRKKINKKRLNNCTNKKNIIYKKPVPFMPMTPTTDESSIQPSASPSFDNSPISDEYIETYNLNNNFNAPTPSTPYNLNTPPTSPPSINRVSKISERDSYFDVIIPRKLDFSKYFPSNKV